MQERRKNIFRSPPPRPTPDNMGASRISASGSNLTAPLNYCAIAALLGALAALLAGHVWQSQRTAASLDVAALRRAIVAGEPLPPSLRQFAERAVSASHAPTELALRLGLESTDRHQTALSLVLVAAAFDGTPVQHELAHVLRSFDPSHSAEAYLARQYGEGLAQRVRGGLPPRSDPPLSIGGWIGAELSSGQSDRVRVLSRRPLVAVVDHFVDDDAVSAAAARLEAARATFGPSVVCVMPGVERAAALQDAARRDGQPEWGAGPFSGHVCGQMSARVEALVGDASTSVQYDAGADADVDRLDAAIGEAIGLPAERGYAQSTAPQLLHYAPSRDAVAAFPLHVDCSDFVGGANAARPNGEPGERGLTALLYLRDSEGATSFPLLGVEVGARAGRLVLFHALDEHGRCDPLGAHAASAPVGGGGPRLVLQKWFFQRALPDGARRGGEGEGGGLRSTAYLKCGMRCRRYARVVKE